MRMSDGRGRAVRARAVGVESHVAGSRWPVAVWFPLVAVLRRVIPPQRWEYVVEVWQIVHAERELVRREF